MARHIEPKLAQVNELTQAIVESCALLNSASKQNVVGCCLSQEARPVLLVQTKNVATLLKLLATRLPPTKSGFSSYCPDLAKYGVASDYDGLQHLIATAEHPTEVLAPGAVERIDITQLGGSAQLASLSGRLKDA